MSMLSTHPVPDPTELKPNECLVKIEYSGVCQSDLHARNGDWKRKPTLPRIGGHEGVGTVMAIGAGTVDSPVALGDRVGIKWIARTCLHCEDCRLGNEPCCPTRLVHGFTVDGTFAEYVVSWTYYVTPIPKSLDSAAAAPILCAGLKLLNVPVGSWIAIPGAGGGLGHLAIQYATAMGFRVIAIDSGEDKRRLCLDLGAEKWIDFKESGDKLVEHVVAVDRWAAPYAQACYYVRVTGTVLLLGVPTSTPLPVPFDVLVGKQLKLIGSMTGTRQDTIEALELVARGKVTVHYTVRPLEELESVFDEMERGKIVGRVVLKI
ncbi:chaperonin 10-like protein [Chiua virens]|nr:chaperonin 10-like protein [Chiua virens]